ncbi:MAG: hypothetical protein AAGF28_06080 [Pseudomonadota bacterium]
MPSREDRVKDALRANLRRRKQKARALLSEQQSAANGEDGEAGRTGPVPGTHSSKSSEEPDQKN